MVSMVKDIFKWWQDIKTYITSRFTPLQTKQTIQNWFCVCVKGHWLLSHTCWAWLPSQGGQTWPRSSFRGPVCSVDQVSRGQFKSGWISWLWAHFKSYQVKLGDDPKAVLGWRDVPRWEPSGRVWSVLPLGEWHTFTPLCYIHPFSQPNCHHQRPLWVTIISLYRVLMQLDVRENTRRELNCFGASSYSTKDNDERWSPCFN